MRQPTKEWIGSIPKTINNNGCWIPIKLLPRKNGYTRVTINYKRYYLHRLVVCIYYSLDYDSKFDTRHSDKCRRICFNPNHLTYGSRSDNMQDAVRAGTHVGTAKRECPRCGGPYSKMRYYHGPNKGKVRRYCAKCKKVKVQLGETNKLG